MVIAVQSRSEACTNHKTTTGLAKRGPSRRCAGHRVLYQPGVVALSETAELKLCFKMGTLISQRLGWRTLNSFNPPKWK